MKSGKLFSILGVSMVAAGMLATAPASSAAPEATPGTTAVSCGFGSDASAYYYNHCGSGEILIRIDYPFSNSTRCVNPGTSFLQWRTGSYFTNPTNAYYIGSC
jgi:hypothetical protein